MYAEINGIRMYYEDRSSSDPTGVIVFIHGFPLNHSMWRQQLDYFAMRYRCIAPDLRGYGSSFLTDGATAEPWSMDMFAEDIIALMDKLGIDKANICGLSMGGYVAFALWRKYRKRVRRLILADTKATGEPAEGKANRARQAELVQAQGARALADEMMPKLIAPTSVKRYSYEVRHMIESTRADTIAATLTALSNRKDMSDWLRRLHVPTLIAMGEQDEIASAKDAQFMKDNIEKSELAIIPDAGHLAPLENAPAFNEAMWKFLRD
jgi:pimeloyl-ACP methyl ester carboxylesterase